MTRRMRPVRQTAGPRGEAVVRILYPRRCPLCGKAGVPAGAFCHEECRGRVRYLSGPYCLRCGTELADGEEELCRACRREPRSFAGGRHVFPYREVTAPLMDLKYRDRREYADFFAAEAVRMLGREIVSWHPDALVPVPLHPRRRRRRGYNQAALLADRIGQALDIPVREDAVRRVRHTRAMRVLSRRERKENLRKAFAAGRTEGLRRVVLVDDIYTTGATAEAVSRTLKEAGVETVRVVTMAAGTDR